MNYMHPLHALLFTTIHIHSTYCCSHPPHARIAVHIHFTHCCSYPLHALLFTSTPRIAVHIHFTYCRSHPLHVLLFISTPRIAVYIHSTYCRSHQVYDIKIDIILTCNGVTLLCTKSYLSWNHHTRFDGRTVNRSVHRLTSSIFIIKETFHINYYRAPDDWSYVFYARDTCVIYYFWCVSRRGDV